MKYSLRQARLLSGYSMQGVCDELKITQGALSNYERGKRKPPYPTLVMLTQLYNLSVEDIDLEML